MTQPISRSSLTRRDLLKNSAIAASAGVFAPGLAVGAATRASANERLNVAIVGMGNKGNDNRVRLQRTGLCNIVALCDVDLEGRHTLPSRIANGDAPVPEGKTAEDYAPIEKKAPCFTDFRVMLDKMAPEIDVVVVSTADHTHFPIAMAAMALGKHVYVEKPLAHTFGECRRLMEMADRSGVVTQMGNQGHSSGNFTQYKAWTEAGVIKDVTRITAFMNKGRRWHGWGSTVEAFPSEPMPKHLAWDAWTGPGTVNPFSKRLHPGNWRCWFEYGSGALGDWAPHILDTSHRFLKLGLPERVTAVHREGTNPLVYPQASTLSFQFPEREGMPACEVTWNDGTKNQPTFEGDLDSFNLESPGKVIYGRDRVFHGTSHGGTLSVISGDRGSLPEYERRVPDHWENFLRACKGENEPSSPFSVSAPLTQVLNLGMISQRLGGTLEFDRATEKITNNRAANELLDPAPRAGWEEFYRM